MADTFSVRYYQDAEQKNGPYETKFEDHDIAELYAEQVGGYIVGEKGDPDLTTETSAETANVTPNDVPPLIPVAPTDSENGNPNGVGTPTTTETSSQA